MIFSVAAIEVIDSHKIVRFKGIGKFIGNGKVPVVTYFIGIIIIQVTVQVGLTVVIMIISITHGKIKPWRKFIVNIQINSTARTNTLIVY